MLYARVTAYLVLSVYSRLTALASVQNSIHVNRSSGESETEKSQERTFRQNFDLYGERIIPTRRSHELNLFSPKAAMFEYLYSIHQMFYVLVLILNGFLGAFRLLQHVGSFYAFSTVQLSILARS